MIRVSSRVSTLLGEPEQLPIRLHGGLADMEIDLRRTALLCVDMQEHVARPRGGPKAEAGRLLGFEAELDYYWRQLEAAIGNLQRLQAAFRRAGLEVLHTKGGLLTPDGRDRGKMKSLLRAGRSRVAGQSGAALPGTVPQDSPIIPELAPLPNEMVFTKNGSTAFGMTRIDLALHNLGIETVVMGGVVTNQCVEATVRGAFDHGFGVILVDDACATYSEDLRRGVLRSIGDWFCKVVTTDQALSWFEEAPAQRCEVLP
ncbi:MAG: cysteine hydrolase family protein [Armatimonadota bacterium]